MSFKLGSSSQNNRYEKRQNSKESDPTYKLVLVGDSGVGKSCLLEKLLDLSSTNAFISTIGVDVRTHIVDLNGQSMKLQVWDTGGQQRYRPVLSTCYRGAHGIIVVYDVTNANSFANLPQWLQEVEEFSPKKDVPKLLVGNKSDLEAKRQIPQEKAQKFAAERQMLYIETSAVAAVNISEAFLSLVRVAAPELSSSASASAASGAS